MKATSTNWNVLVSTYTFTVLGVYGSALKAECLAKRDEIEAQTGVPVIHYNAVFNQKPRVGRTLALCCYCHGPVGKTGLVIEGHAAHKNCEKEASK